MSADCSEENIETNGMRGKSTDCCFGSGKYGIIVFIYFVVYLSFRTVI